MKRIKTDWRSRLGSDTVTDLMTIMLHSKPVSTFDPTPSVTHWSGSGSRKRRPSFRRQTAPRQPAVPVTEAVSSSSSDEDSDF